MDSDTLPVTRIMYSKSMREEREHEMYTITLIIHVDDQHSTSVKHVDTLDDVTSLIEQVEDGWSGSGVSVHVTRDTLREYTIRVEN